jgi:hypothetical protein
MGACELSGGKVLSPVLALLLEEARLIENAVVDIFDRLVHQRRIRVAEDVDEHLFLALRLKDGFAHPRFYGADISGELQTLAQEGGYLPIDLVDFASPLFKFPPVIIVHCTAFGHDTVVG